MTAVKLLFAGTPEFALESLRALHKASFVPAAVLTQPDRPAGRGKKLTQSPVKQFAREHDIPVWQPETLKDAGIVAQISQAKPNLMIVAAYGLLLPRAVLDLPERGCVNVHASLLPRWRGAAPIQAAILEGDSQTGALQERLAVLGGELLVEKIGEILGGDLEAIPQDDALATYAGKIRKRDAAIDWNLTAEQISRKIRAYDPVPGASFDLDGEIIKCWKAEPLAGGEGRTGTILSAGKDGVVVACAEGALRLAELQRPGRRRVTAAEFAGQYKLGGKRLN